VVPFCLVAGTIGALSAFACLAILFFIAEPLWLFTWFLGSAVLAAAGFGGALLLLARRE
jgi:hypothetical protein